VSYRQYIKATSGTTPEERVSLHRRGFRTLADVATGEKDTSLPALQARTRTYLIDYYQSYQRSQGVNMTRRQVQRDEQFNDLAGRLAVLVAERRLLKEEGPFGSLEAKQYNRQQMQELFAEIDADEREFWRNMSP
jgi:hypothetical protein